MQRRKSMSKLRKLVVTVAALAALAVGGAAFAQAQNAATPITAPTHQNVGEETSPGDTDGVQVGDHNGSDQADEADSQDSASGQSEAPDSASKADIPDGPTEPADQGSQED
jgi:cytoskeletal protein RodZ